MKALVVAEHDNAALQPATYHAVTAALAITTDVELLVAGSACDSVAKEAATLQGLKKVWIADAPCYQHFLAEPLTDLVIALSNQFHYSYLLASADAFGKNLLPRVAALLDVAPISDIIKVILPDTFVRPIYAGNVVETVQSTDPIKVITIRSTAFDVAIVGESSAAIEKVSGDFFPSNRLSEYVSQQLTQSLRPELASAKIIVAGGKGLGSSEQFQALLAPLADCLGAAIGASRAAVDAGYISNAYQIGQTGKVVAPALYIAIGISGAIQHLTGMKDSQVIVAINKNKEEPIFQVADYGIVGDLFEVVPQLQVALSKMR